VFADRVPDKQMHDMIHKEASNCHNPAHWCIEAVDKWPSVAEQYNVDTVPTTIFFFEGQEKGRVVGRDEEALHINFVEHFHRDGGAHDRDCLQ
jgi:thioredoxin-like negative regulator of GroEL